MSPALEPQPLAADESDSLDDFHADARLELELQRACQAPNCPDTRQFHHWASAALLDEPTATQAEPAQLAIRLVDVAESTALNGQYRHRSGPTNVLSFPSQAPRELAGLLLGDLVICAPLVTQEATQQGKTELAHWAHLTVHGCLHLQGLDHLHNHEAERMEALERRILEQLGFPDPYAEIPTSDGPHAALKD